MVLLATMVPKRFADTTNSMVVFKISRPNQVRGGGRRWLLGEGLGGWLGGKPSEVARGGRGGASPGL